MRRLSLWLKAHPTAGDTVLALALAGLELLVTSGLPDGALSVWFWVVGVGLLAPLLVRRHRPVLAAYLVLAAGFLQLFTHGAEPGSGDMRVRMADLALGICLYTLVAYVGRRQATLYAAWLTVGTVAWAVWRMGLPEGVVPAAVFSVVFALCWTLGEFSGARRAYHVEVERRLDLLETERDQQARIAVADERTRIARELHDVVAHAVSVIVVQADGAAYAVRTQPEAAEQALAVISTTGREALTELRRLLGVLRSDGTGSGRAPQPGTRSISELAERVRATGVPVRLDLAGELDSLPAGVGLGVYRIVQEALTNTIKHAGPGARADVLVSRVGDRVELDITDRGPGLGTAPGLTTGGGNGLIGMRERANVFGGTLQAGPRPEGGWRVRAVLPVAERLG
ncbi:two-component system sensor kinase [Actinokineospora spheciospongiae]|uniref:histidine kinase n=1 Tax=Actinokineospora spheciospongiae TaxID=909613 RepID=W7IWP7_9PSEU|nr:histidine kinase [Actinokineospora spheciospongiae]EWC58449.1 two-component system sensor kinase [Actinokineospora spheciospongiae]PWW61876.1 signal transduction histidine kinase [Actinokineospora spheciospongiae]